MNTPSRPAPAAMPQDGDLVAVEVAQSRRGVGLPVARVTERLGSLASERAVSLIAINAHQIPHVFPASRGEGSGGGAARTPRRPRGLARRAARHHRSGRRQGPRRRRAGRGRQRSRTIAAASSSASPSPMLPHYVRPGSALDREALIRGNSVYFPDRVVPMLPERISNDLCSLRPQEDRAALAVRIVVDADGRKRSHTFPSRADALGGKTQLPAGAGGDRRLARRHHRAPARRRSRTALRRLRARSNASAPSAVRSTSICPNASSY